ncbi:MAG: type II toxin-antitoxin system VapC family toxin [Geitlerinemataceae cyanobacterium]
MPFIVDTNILSEAFKRNPNQAVTDWLTAQDQLAVSTITLEELTYGLDHRKSPTKMAWLQSLLTRRCELLPVTSEIATRSALMRSQFRKQGITRSQPDMLIAATAAQYNLTVATRNTKDFQACNLQLFDPFRGEYL